MNRSIPLALVLMRFGRLGLAGLALAPFVVAAAPAIVAMSLEYCPIPFSA